MKKLFCCVVVFSFVFLFLSQLPAEEVKIKIVDGIRVVYNPKNPAPPKGVPAKLVLKEDFSLGESGQEEEMFSQITAAVLDDEGNIYILDREENKVVAFDKGGKHLRTFGKKGQGPGEMNGPVGIHITPDKELLIEDGLNQRLGFFSLDGKFLRNISTAKALGLAGIVIDSQGNMIAQHVVLDNNKLTRVLKKFDKELNALFTIASFDFPNIMAGKIDPFSFLTFYEMGKDDSILLSNPEEYEIKVLNFDGEVIKRILKEHEPVKITEEDKQEILARLPAESAAIKDRIEFQKNFPPYRGFSLDDEGRLFVRTFAKGKTKDEFLWDVFDAEGKYIARIPLKGEIQAWKGNKLFTVEETEDGFHILRCFSASWEK